MKHIKTFKIFESSSALESELESKLKEFKIENYTINEDGTIDVHDKVILRNKELTKIPFNFGKVDSIFVCHSNKLTSLEGCPSIVGGNFYCQDNQLTSLEFCPSEVGTEFSCANNQLTSLKGCPKEINGDFICANNQLTSLEYCPTEIGRHLVCLGNKLTMLDCSSYVKGNILCWKNEFTEEPDFLGDCEGKIIWKK